MPIKELIIKNIREYNYNKDKNSWTHKVIEACKKIKINLNTNQTQNITPIPPWYDLSHKLVTKFMDNFKKDLPNEIIKTQFQMLISTVYENYHKIFTDG